MGKITNVLNKIQQSRQPLEDQKISEPSYPNTNKEDLQAYSQKVVMGIVAIVVAGTLVVVFISNEIYNLKKTIKMQEKRFNDLTVFLSNTKNFSDSQVQDFDFRLKNESEDRRIQINKLALIDNVYYINFIKSTQANTLRINHLDKYTQDLKAEIEKIAINSQAKNSPLPPSGN